MALGVCQPCIGVCATHVDTCLQVGEAAGAWQHVEAPTEPISAAFNRSASDESDRGIGFSNRSTEAPDLDFESYGGAGRVNIVAGTFSDAWGHVAALMAVFPPYNDRSGDDLSIGGGLYPRRFLESRFRRSWWLGRAWWHVGNPAEHSSDA